ncbi:MAG: DUF58 domain-containing protein [Bryobacteraceae bacterium]|jgi:uncharacterized protein (DUF58 family)
MIAPRTRLLVVFGLTVAPAAALTSSPLAALTAWLFIGSFVLVAFLDAVLGSRNLDGITLSLPGVVRFVRRRKGVIPVTVRNGGAGVSRVRAGMVLSQTLGSDADDFTLDLPARGESVTALLHANPQTRGTFAVDAAALEAPSPLGLWNARRRIAVRSEIRVYPDLGGDRSVVAPLLMRRHPGLHVQRQAGRGREFEKLREYIPGDALNEIHWKATARRGHPITRQYRVERTQEIYAVLDCSRLTGRDAGEGETVLERYITASLVLSLACRQQGDLFGLVTFSDTAHSFVRAGGTHAHYDACRNALLNLAPRMVAPDFGEVAAALDTRLRRRAMLVFLTELDDPVLAEDFLKVAGSLARRHLVAVASVRDTSEEALFELPAGSVPEVYERLGGHLAWRRLTELAASLRSRGVRMFTAHPAKLSLELTRFYLNTKQRQAI